MPTIPQVLLFNGDAAPSHPIYGHLEQRGLHVRQVAPEAALSGELLHDGSVALVIGAAAKHGPQAEQTRELVERLASGRIATLVWGVPERSLPVTGPLVDAVGAGASQDEVIGRLTALVRYAPVVRGLERELSHLQRLGQQLNRYFGEIDQEMRLAGRMQRDFLPGSMPELPPLKFRALYRPASWVSGDMYDVFRIDEQRVGVFEADAMGHGIAAGLMTMFLHRGLMPKEVDGSRYRIIQPAEAMSNLHTLLLNQRLPNCQFVTAVYAIIDVGTLEMCVSRAGHPYPLHIRADGAISEVETGGGLLGIADVEPEFGERRVRLSAGDKVVFYTDGIEDVLIQAPAAEEGEGPRFTPQLLEWAKLRGDVFMEALGRHLDCLEGSLHQADDVTVVMVEVGE